MTRALFLTLALVVTSAAAAHDRRVLIWLYDCSSATLDALANHTDSFTALAPSLYTVGQDDAGGAVLSGDAAGCVQLIKSTLPGIEIWPWITSPDAATPR